MTESAFNLYRIACASHRRADWRRAAIALADALERLEAERALPHIPETAYAAPAAYETLQAPNGRRLGAEPVRTNPEGRESRPTSPEMDLPDALEAQERAGVAPPRPIRKPSLIKFLADTGGIRDDGGELANRDLQLWHRFKPFQRRLLNPNGRSMEHAAEAAWEAGFWGRDLPARGECPVDSAMLMDAIERELRSDDFHALEPEEIEQWNA